MLKEHIKRFNNRSARALCFHRTPLRHFFQKAQHIDVFKIHPRSTKDLFISIDSHAGRLKQVDKKRTRTLKSPIEKIFGI